MVNCKGVASFRQSPVNQEICRYCRTRVCEECYVAATSRNSMLQSELVTPSHHQHLCLACSRLQSGAKMSRSPRQNRLPRLNSAPRLDSLTTDQDQRVVSSGDSSYAFLSASGEPEQQSSHQSPKNMIRAEPQTDHRRRRHTSAIAPTSRGLTARELLRANATDLHTSKRTDKTNFRATRRTANKTELHTSMRVPIEAPTSYSCDFTGSTPRMALRTATSTGAKKPELSMKDLRGLPKSRSCDFTGMDLSDVPNELELSAVDLRLPKYKVDIPAPTKRGRRSSRANPANSALTPISIENLVALDAKLSSVELELKRYDAPTGRKQQSEAPESVIDADESSSSKKYAAPMDLHLSTVDLQSRPRRHTTTEMKCKSSQRQESVVEEVEVEQLGGFARFQREKVAEPIDFHLSTFDLKPHRHTKPKPNPTEVDLSSKKEKKALAMPTPQYSKQEPCDLGYLENFRSFTV